MKNVLFVLIFVLFVGCMSDREKYEKEFTDGCLRNYPLQEKEAQKACECLAKLTTSRFSDKELSIALKKYHTPQERQLISQKMNYIEREVWGNKQALEKYIRKCMQDN